MKFLQQIAKYYIEAAQGGKLQLHDYTFVFPNKRSAMFMRKYLREELKATAFMPKLITITAFTQSFCKLPIPSNSELLYILYDAYRNVMDGNPSALDFDKFIFWGNIILSDFNDIDAYLADPKAIFDNLENLNSISAQYLTDEQKEVAQALGLHTDYSEQGHTFWKQFDSPKQGKTGNKQKFLRLWQILGQLYDEFHRLLKEKGLVYSGLQSRMAYEKVKPMSAQDFGNSRFAFVGFYVLPTSRYKIFKKLRTLGVADFFWDNGAPLLRLKGNKAGMIINPLVREFPQPAEFKMEEIKSFPHFEICPITSNVGQAKQAALKLQEWENDGSKNSRASIDSVNTAVIMPNDRLLLPFIYALPQSVTKFNVAMRVPFTATPFATLLQSVMAMQEHARNINGSVHYFYKDVLSVLSHPHIAAMAIEEVQTVRRNINDRRIYNVPADELCEWAPSLHFFFKAYERKSLQQTQQYLQGVLDGLAYWLQDRAQHYNVSKADEAYELQIIKAYHDVIAEIAALSEAYKVTMQHTTFFAILRRALLYKEIPFNGDPVSGLQILGTQDSRVLDFDNLIILSLNERIFPPKGKTHSMIPQSLRIGYALPTIEDEQITFAYQFYRITARASRIALFYDSRPIDVSQGEVSRFISQLVNLLPEEYVTVSNFETNLGLGNERCMEVQKTEAVMAQLSAFKAHGENARNISASALKDYLKCPMMFYLQDVCRLNLSENEIEYIDAASYGSIIHAVAQDFYEKLQEQLGDSPITPAVLQEEIDNAKAFVDKLTVKALRVMDDIYYYGKYKDDLTQVPGEGRVMAKIIANYMLQMVRQEIKYGKTFWYCAGEYKGKQKSNVLRLDHHAFNFTMSIDRIDRLVTEQGEVLRFVDYKTGSDDVSAASWDDIMTDHKKGGIFQLLTYAFAYRQLIDEKARISPYIYKFSEMSPNKKGIKPISLNKQPILDCCQSDNQSYTGLSVIESFEIELNRLVDEIFSPEVSFVQTSDIKNCEYCSFAAMCGRAVDD